MVTPSSVRTLRSRFLKLVVSCGIPRVERVLFRFSLVGTRVRPDALLSGKIRY